MVVTNEIKTPYISIGLWRSMP